MKNEDATIFAVVFLVWTGLALIYFTVPMVYMPTNARVWGLGALLFLVLTLLIVYADAVARRRR
jgi:hypothetical protein